MSDQSDNAAPAPRRRSQAPATGTDTVTIACNLPNGLTMILYDHEEVVNFLPNGRELREFNSTIRESAGRWRLNGTALDLRAIAGGDMPDYRVIKGSAPSTGYALTNGIPRDFAEEWFRQNKDSVLVRSAPGREPHVYMASTEARAADEAREYKNGRSGYQPLNPAGDYRVPSARNVRKYSPTDNRTSPEQPELESEVG